MKKDTINSIIQGDCLELFKRIPDNFVDMSFADPPFNLKKKYNSYKDSLEFKDYISWCEKWISEMVRVTKPTGSIYIHNIPKWLTYFSAILNKIAFFKHWISWDAPTAPMGKTLQPAHYGILFYAKDEKKIKFNEIRYPHKRDRKTSYLLKDYGGKKAKVHPFGPLVSDVWTDIHRIKHNKNRDPHPCQLPIHLLERLVLMSTDENDIVFDPFMGTGTTAIAAKRLGRNYIGFELDQKYVEVSREKLSKTNPDSKIGNNWVSYYLNKIRTLRNKDWDSIKKYFYIPSDRKLIDKEEIKLIKPKDMNFQLVINKNNSQLYFESLK
jgi:site-specific DNA-methyltransferase (adenine-specific)